MIQHGNEEEGFKYEVICPYCGKTVGHIIDEDDTLTESQYRFSLFQLQKKHIEGDGVAICQFPASSTLEVQESSVPLGTDNKDKFLIH